MMPISLRIAGRHHQPGCLLVRDGLAADLLTRHHGAIGERDLFHIPILVEEVILDRDRLTIGKGDDQIVLVVLAERHVAGIDIHKLQAIHRARKRTVVDDQI